MFFNVVPENFLRTRNKTRTEKTNVSNDECHVIQMIIFYEWKAFNYTKTRQTKLSSSRHHTSTYYNTI